MLFWSSARSSFSHRCIGGDVERLGAEVRLFEKRYPSKNTVRLTAELERETGHAVVFQIHGQTLSMNLGDHAWAGKVNPTEAWDVDMEKRRLLVLARRSLRDA